MKTIDKLPSLPRFNNKIVCLITALLFLKDKDNLPKDTVYQILGNIAFLDTLVEKVKTIGSDNNVIISGGINPKYKKQNLETNFVKTLYTKGGERNFNDVLNKSEAKIIKKELLKNNINNNYLLEEESTNCKENITKSLDANLYKNVKELAIITTNENTLRAKLTAEKYLPNVNISTIGYTASIKDKNINVDKNNWMKNDFSKQYVWGEFIRIVTYSNNNEFKLAGLDSILVNKVLEEINRLNR